MRVIVTGAAGFLGSHLSKFHLQKGDEVLGIDNFCSSKGFSSPHMLELMSFENFRFMMRDICELAPLHAHYDVVYNMACPASPPIYQKMPIETMMTCTLGTKNVLDLARKSGAIMVHASTSEVYGDPWDSPQLEADRGNVNSYGPRACYDEGKRAAEALCYDYLHRHNVDARLVRIFNTYGPNMDPNDGRVVSNFICQALRREPLTVYGDGQQTRSLCYVDDMVRGIVAMGALEKNPETPINVGNPHELTVHEIAHRVIQRLNGSMTKVDLPADDPKQRKPDITLATRVLKWKPEVKLDEGLDKTIEYFKSVVR